MTKISVIIPVYNAQKYLARCLESVINQTFQDIEIICINDKSEDNSSKILDEYSKKDKRIKVIENAQNIGAALTRNLGIDCAKGKYIYFIDADDYIEPEYLECMYNTIEKEKADIILNLSIMNESNGVQHKYKHPSMPEINPKGEYLDKISTIHNAPCFIWARLYRKSFLDKHKLRFLDINATDDVVFNAITNLNTEKTFIFFGENYHYTIDQTSVTGMAKSSDNRDLQHIKAHSLIYDYMKERNLFDDRIKLFMVYPFMKVDTEEKFNYYRNFVLKIEKDFRKNENNYNDLEKYFAESLLSSQNYEEYLKNYNKVVTIGFIRRGKK